VRDCELTSSTLLSTRTPRRSIVPTRLLPVASGILALVSNLVTIHPALASVSTKQASLTRRGGDPLGFSYATSVNADGRYVAFFSFANDLVAGDHTRQWLDVFVRDTLAGVTVRANVDVNGGDPNDGLPDAFEPPALTADGRYVGFASPASDLIPGDGKGQDDVFVRDLVTGSTIRASVDMGGHDANGYSLFPSMSADGRYVAFLSSASDLVPGDGNGTEDVFVRDLVAGTTRRASVDAEGGDPDGYSTSPSISADGRYVAFASYATDIVPGDGNGRPDVFVRDLVGGVSVRVSVDTGGGDPNAESWGPSVSADGRMVAFWSFASDLVPGDGNGEPDVFVRDLMAGSTVRASVDSDGGDANDFSSLPSISDDGRFVAFSSGASDLVIEDANGEADVFVRDLVAEVTTRVSVDARGGDPDSSSCCPSISGDGHYVTFRSAARDLMSQRGDRPWDVFVVRWA
jgi:Tol biopolymer transport system component